MCTTSPLYLEARPVAVVVGLGFSPPSQTFIAHIAQIQTKCTGEFYSHTEPLAVLQLQCWRPRGFRAFFVRFQWIWGPVKFPASLVVGLKHDKNILLMKEMLHHRGCIKPRKGWDKLPINWLFGISSINGIKVDSILLLFSWFTWSELTWVFVSVNCWFFRNLPRATGEGFYQCHQTHPNVFLHDPVPPTCKYRSRTSNF